MIFSCDNDWVNQMGVFFLTKREHENIKARTRVSHIVKKKPFAYECQIKEHSRKAFTKKKSIFSAMLTISRRKVFFFLDVAVSGEFRQKHGKVSAQRKRVVASLVRLRWLSHYFTSTFFFSFVVTAWSWRWNLSSAYANIFRWDCRENIFCSVSEFNSWIVSYSSCHY